MDVIDKPIKRMVYDRPEGTQLGIYPIEFDQLKGYYIQRGIHQIEVTSKNNRTGGSFFLKDPETAGVLRRR